MYCIAVAVAYTQSTAIGLQVLSLRFFSRLEFGIVLQVAIDRVAFAQHSGKETLLYDYS